MPRASHPDRVAVAGQSEQRRNITSVLFRGPNPIYRYLIRREPDPLGLRRAIAVPIESRMVHQNRQTASSEEHQEKEVHKNASV
jgi:hypothetical protein